MYPNKRTRGTSLLARRGRTEAAGAVGYTPPDERAKLSAVRLAVPRLNLSGLTDDELAFLRRTILKESASDLGFAPLAGPSGRMMCRRDQRATAAVICGPEQR